MSKPIILGPEERYRVLTDKEVYFVTHIIPIYQEVIRSNIKEIQSERSKLDGEKYPNIAQHYRRILDQFEGQLKEAEDLAMKLTQQEEGT